MLIEVTSGKRRILLRVSRSGIVELIEPEEEAFILTCNPEESFVDDTYELVEVLDKLLGSSKKGVVKISRIFLGEPEVIMLPIRDKGEGLAVEVVRIILREICGSAKGL